MLVIHTDYQGFQQSQKQGTVGMDRSRKSEGVNSMPQMGLDWPHIEPTSRQ